VDQPDFALRHIPFFEALATSTEEDSDWPATSAGLVVLRFVDAWLEEGPSVATADAWGLHAVRSAISEVDTGRPVRAILTGIVDAIERATVADMGLLAPRLMAYGRALDYEAKYTLAGDVYATVIAHVHPLEDTDVAIDANMRLGFCCRMVGNLEGAAAGYGRAGQIGASVGDMMAVLHARIGDAKLAMARGNLPGAEAILDETIDRAGEQQFIELRAMALHDRGSLANSRGDFERAVRFYYEAMRDTTSPRERDRILADIAASFIELGVRSAARDALLILAATAEEQYSRWSSVLNLLTIAALDRCEPVFEQYRRELADVELPTRLQADYYLYVGRGYRIFGRDDAARASFEKAIEVAARFGLNQVVFDAELALTDLVLGRRASAREKGTAQAPDAVRDVVRALGEMKVAAGVG
jgi:tetratricopeptide (TPR) repeat protein